MKAPPRLELTHATNDYIFSLGSLEGQTSPSCSGRRGPPPPPYSKKLWLSAQHPKLITQELLN
ncbi:hypothetical protein, partial [Archaeoglobus sp.]|uniref:hypothetical protein n=1 Tax=Archaeoglobus sp. TaxID=1872626 RepID=UPI0025C1A8D2